MFVVLCVCVLFVYCLFGLSFVAFFVVTVCCYCVLFSSLPLFAWGGVFALRLCVLSHVLLFGCVGSVCGYVCYVVVVVCVFVCVVCFGCDC